MSDGFTEAWKNVTLDYTKEDARKNTEILINNYKGFFRILNDWTIEYDVDSNCKNKCHYDSKAKHAIIYELTNHDVTFYKYVIHELLHISQSELRRRKKNRKDVEEIYVQDITNLIV